MYYKVPSNTEPRHSLSFPVIFTSFPVPSFPVNVSSSGQCPVIDLSKFEGIVKILIIQSHDMMGLQRDTSIFSCQKKSGKLFTLNHLDLRLHSDQALWTVKMENGRSFSILTVLRDKIQCQWRNSIPASLWVKVPFLFLTSSLFLSNPVSFSSSLFINYYTDLLSTLLFFSNDDHERNICMGLAVIHSINFLHSTKPLAWSQIIITIFELLCPKGYKNIDFGSKQKGIIHSEGRKSFFLTNKSLYISIKNECCVPWEIQCEIGRIDEAKGQSDIPVDTGTLWMDNRSTLRAHYNGVYYS